MSAMSIGVRYSKSKKEKNSANITVEALIERNAPIPRWKKKILAVIRGIEKFLIFLAPKHFLIRTDCKEILDFIKKNLSNMQAQVGVSKKNHNRKTEPEY